MLELKTVYTLEACCEFIVRKHLTVMFSVRVSDEIIVIM